MEEQKTRLYSSIRLPAYFIGLLFAVRLFQLLLSWDLGFMGIYPRQLFGLKGIVLAPLVHGDISHLLSNSVPLFVLWSMILYFYRKVAIKSFVLIYLLTGMAVWFFGRSVFHIGASGIVYGLVTFLLGNGLFRRNTKSIVLALIILFFYSGMFVGILPNQEGISWESHLYGALVGIFTAYFYREELELEEEEQISFEEPELSERPYFLERNIFEKTKEERRKESEADDNSGWTSTSTWEEI